MATKKPLKVSERIALSYDDASTWTGFSRLELANAVLAGEIQAFKRGKETVLLREDVEKYLRNSKTPMEAAS